MREVIAKVQEVIPLGKQGENAVEVVYFPVINAWKVLYGDGEFTLLHQREGDIEPYPVAIEIIDDQLAWTVEAADVANPGLGKAELIYIVDDAVAISWTYTTRVIPSLGGPGDPPEPVESWITQVLTGVEFFADDAAQSAKDAEDYSKSAEQSAENAEAAAARVKQVVFNDPSNDGNVIISEV